MQLSEDQKQVLNSETKVVSACPGAGKTRAILARFDQQVHASTRGVALVSFTNTAVEEILSRTRAQRYLAKPPNFIGTFDRFIHQFIVTPHVTRISGRRPQYVDSWDDLKADWTQLREGSAIGKGIELSQFTPDSSGELTLTEAPNAGTQQYLRTLSTAGITIDGIRDRAQKLAEGLTAKHIYDCDHARILALKLLKGSILDPVTDRLRKRFSEIIIDEFQDCSQIEYDIRSELKKLGINVVVVADPDQGIYEFRNAKPQLFSDLVASTAPSSVVRLNDCHRSSDAICAITTSLRAELSDKITSAVTDRPEGIPEHIFILAGTDSARLEKFRRLMADFDIALSEGILLAPTRKQCAKMSGDTTATIEDGYHNTGKLLSILMRLNSSRDPEIRRRSLPSYLALIFKCFDLATLAPEARTNEAKLDYLKLEMNTVRLSLAQLLAASDKWTIKAHAKDAILAEISNVTKDLNAPRLASLGRIFMVPREDIWNTWLSRKRQTEYTGIQHTHIHGVKGLEFPAVMLHIPHKIQRGIQPGLNDWDNGVGSEARRILYVGASRAQYLLALSVAPSRQSDLTAILDRDGIPYKIL